MTSNQHQCIFPDNHNIQKEREKKSRSKKLFYTSDQNFVRFYLLIHSFMIK